MDLFERLRDDIITHKIENGTKLTEQSVCTMYGVSRTPVREAFQKLEYEGLIDIVPNRGAFVRGLRPQDLADMYDMRKAYEVICVQLAIDRITEEDMAHLSESFELMEFFRHKEDAVKFSQKNREFHQIIYGATDNRMLQHVLSSFQAYAKETKLSLEYVIEHFDQVLAEHKAIYEAFAKKDKEAAVAAITVHMDNSKKRAGFGNEEN